MCTVTFLYLGNSSVLISHRYESPLRQKAQNPGFQIKNGIEFICPIDPTGSGTWVGVNEMGTAIILRNGAFALHSPSNTSYRKGKGVIVYDLLGSKDALGEWAKYNPENIEPFITIVYTGKQLRELVWNGVSKYDISHSIDKPAICSSSTLYSPEAKKLKGAYFFELLNKGVASSDGLFQKLHSFDDAQNGFFINRSDTLRTLSTTTSEIEHKSAELKYFDQDASSHFQSIVSLKRHESDFINALS